ncbi:unnamed protein product [Cuscuta europaea]|uniref:Uncharacterized protein n=1 Tax=Cuscuta europaea TaxID=41803 RepID=A0A9P0YS84_CUSEU|nr:unnamed protein product [Cuscuta europaea]
MMCSYSSSFDNNNDNNNNNFLVTHLLKVHFAILLSHHIIFFSVFLFFSHLLLKIISFLTPLLISTTLLLIFHFFLSPFVGDDEGDSLFHVEGFELYIICLFEEILGEKTMEGGFIKGGQEFESSMAAFGCNRDEEDEERMDLLWEAQEIEACMNTKKEKKVKRKKNKKKKKKCGIKLKEEEEWIYEEYCYTQALKMNLGIGRHMSNAIKRFGWVKNGRKYN